MHINVHVCIKWVVFNCCKSFPKRCPYYSHYEDIDIYKNTIIMIMITKDSVYITIYCGQEGLSIHIALMSLHSAYLSLHIRTMGKPPKYMTELRRDECTSIFAIRSRMIRTKTNHTRLHTNNTCRWCEAPQWHTTTYHRRMPTIQRPYPKSNH